MVEQPTRSHAALKSDLSKGCQLNWRGEEEVCRDALASECVCALVGMCICIHTARFVRVCMFVVSIFFKLLVYLLNNSSVFFTCVHVWECRVHLIHECSQCLNQASTSCLKLQICYYFFSSLSFLISHFSQIVFILCDPHLAYHLLKHISSHLSSDPSFLCLTEYVSIIAIDQISRNQNETCCIYRGNCEMQHHLANLKCTI